MSLSSSSPLLLRSLDLYEIIGNHHDEISPPLTILNEMIEQDWIGREWKLFEELMSLCGRSFRTSAVLGVSHTFSYRLFLPAHEIGIALDHLFSIREEMSVYYFRIYHCLVEWIHPFQDGNGRLARLLLTILLRSRGYPCLIHTDYKILNFLQYCSMIGITPR
jgi:hypothetical protein